MVHTYAATIKDILRTGCFSVTARKTVMSPTIPTTPENPLRKVTFTSYPNVYTSFGEEEIQSWEDWIKLLSVHQTRGAKSDSTNKIKLNRAKEGPAIVLGQMLSGAPHEDKYVLSIHALGLDIDHSTDEEVLAAFKVLAPFEYVVWTTHKHGSEVAEGLSRLRVVLPLAEPILPSQHAATWAALDRLVGGVNCPSTKNPSRFYYLPSTFDPSVARTMHHPGRWISLQDLQAEAETDPSANPLVDARAAQKIRSKIKVMSNGEAFKEAFAPLLVGEPFAEEGRRHSTALALTLGLAELAEDLTEGALREIFGASLQVMAEQDPDAPDLKEVVTAYRGAVARKRKSFADSAEKKKKEDLVKQAEKGSPGQGPYTTEDLERIATRNGWLVADLETRWIIQADDMAWALTQTGDYVGPIRTPGDRQISLRQHLSRAPISLLQPSKTGEIKFKSFGEVASMHGSLASKVVPDLTAQRHTYDPKTSTIYEALVPLRKELVPFFDPDIDGWLQVLGGEENYPKLINWLASAPKLDRLLCALYFNGAPGSGKTLFATGVAKLWTDGPPANIDAVLSTFNEDLARCPLVLADEEIPRQFIKQSVSSLLRTLLSVFERPLTRKYRTTAQLKGAVRLILCANNESLLDTRDAVSEDDLAAVAQRFLYIVAPQAATDLILSHGNKVEEWGRTGIARHALWLAENHKAERGENRFWVEGDKKQMARLLTMGSKWHAMAQEWLVRYLMNPTPFDSKRSGLIRRGGGKLMVNAQALIDGWLLYHPQTKVEPETPKLNGALRAITSGKTVQLRHEGRQIRYRTVNLDQLLGWSEHNGIGDKETMLAAVGGELCDEPEGPRLALVQDGPVPF